MHQECEQPRSLAAAAAAEVVKWYSSKVAKTCIRSARLSKRFYLCSQTLV
jgi:hypothetical protein